MRIAIIGAGVGGLTAAFDLSKAGHTVTIYEREGGPGGLAGGFKLDEWDWSVEKYYHHWFSTDKSMLSLIDELQLSSNIVFRKPKTVVFHDGGFFPLDSVFAVLRFPGFSFLDKMRFGLITAYLKYISGWKNLEKFTAVDWIERYYGKNLFKVFFEPLLVGKFDAHYQKVNMAWMWARFKARSAKLGTYSGGFQAFLDDFTKILKGRGVHFNFNTTVTNISEDEAHGLQIKLADGSRKDFDQVLVTLPPHLLLKLAPALPAVYTEKISRMQGTGAIVMVFALTKRLSEKRYYWFNLPKSAGFPFLALVEHTNFMDEESFNGDHIIYCGDYLDMSHPYFSLSENELADIYLDAFNKINPEFSKSWIKQRWLFKTPFAQPIPEIDHSERIPEIETPINGMFLASMSQIYPWDRGTNFAVLFAHKAARLMLSASQKR